MRRIMVVEDEIVIAAELDELLVSLGHEVVGVASAGEQAIEMAQELRPELILMDIVLPGELDGIGAAEKIMADINIPVIFMTGFSDREFMDRARRLKPFGYVLKPFQGTQIEAAIEIALQKKELEDALLESQGELRRLSSHLMETQERERKRISLELHDELGQALMVLKLKLSAIDRRIPKDQIELREDCRELRQYVDQIIDKVRGLSHGLTPPNIEDLGLSGALSQLLKELTKNMKIQTESEIGEMNHLFSLEEQTNIYRIFQEALTNIVKHAQARLISITVKRLKDTISLVVEDDGRGFEVEKVLEETSTERGLGLTAMEERIRLLRGNMDIRSRRGKGTRLTFSIPITE